MKFYFLDRALNVLGLAFTELPEGFAIRDDKLKERADTSTRTLSFNLVCPQDQIAEAMVMAEPGNYLIYQSGLRSHFFTVIDSDIDADDQSIDIYAEDAELDLLNDIFPANEGDTTSRTLKTWLSYFAGGAGFTVGTCASTSPASMAISFQDSGTALERLQTVAGLFGVELDFSFKIEHFSIAGKYISAYTRKGGDTGILLRDGMEISNLKVLRSADKLVTALRPEGTDGTTISASVYDDGDIYTAEGSPVLYCRSAITRYGRSVPGSSARRAIIGGFAYDTSSAGVLLSEAIRHLKRYSVPETEYECDIHGVALSAGDTVRMASERLQVHETVRVLSLEKSECSNKCRATLGSL